MLSLPYIWRKIRLIYLSSPWMQWCKCTMCTMSINNHLHKQLATVTSFKVVLMQFQHSTTTKTAKIIKIESPGIFRELMILLLDVSMLFEVWFHHLFHCEISCFCCELSCFVCIVESHKETISKVPSLTSKIQPTPVHIAFPLHVHCVLLQLCRFCMWWNVTTG